MASDKPARSRPPLTDDETAEQLTGMLDRHLGMLSEHFSSVQIIATGLESDGRTRLYSRGNGDYYARKGAAQDWLAVEKPKRK